MKYIEPKSYAKSFTCPHCGTLSMQVWWHVEFNGQRYDKSDSVRVSNCHHCEKSTLWVKDKMVFPDTGSAPFPNSEMPEAVLKLYREAASIQSKSPRGAAALLRLAIQILCKELGEAGKNINKDISNLVNKGLPDIVQKSLDIVRVTGNDAVHPGQIDTDNPEIATKLFELVNIIVEYMIALPKQVSGLYDTLPNDKTEAIKNRDNK